MRKDKVEEGLRVQYNGAEGTIEKAFKSSDAIVLVNFDDNGVIPVKVRELELLK